MTAVNPSTFDIAKDIALPIAGGIVGWFASQIFMSKKDRKDFEQKNFENSTNLRDAHDKAYDLYTKAVRAYVEAPTSNGTDFIEIATTGDRYFLQLNFLCAAILSGKVDDSVRDGVLLARIRNVADRTLADHYRTLREIADKHGFSHPAEFRREDYSAIFGVVEKFGNSPDWA